jgi:hypothetical protein
MREHAGRHSCVMQSHLAISTAAKQTIAKQTVENKPLLNKQVLQVVRKTYLSHL